MFERRSLFINVSVLLLIQNGILAIIVSHFTPSLSPAMTAALAAGVIAISMTTAMMATRIAGASHVEQSPGSRTQKALARAPALSGAEPPSLRSASRLIAIPQVQPPRPERDERLQSAELAMISLENGLRRLASADLSTRLETALPDRFEGMRGDFNHAMISLDTGISAITASADSLNSECAQARARIDERRIHALHETPILSSVADDLSERSIDLQTQATGLRHIGAIAGAYASDLAGKRDEAKSAAGELERLAGAHTGMGEVAGTMRDVAFRANMLSVNASVSAANDKAPETALKSFAFELRELAQEAADVAKRASLVERELVASVIRAKLATESLVQDTEQMSQGLETMQSRLCAMSTVAEETAPAIERSAWVLEELGKSNADDLSLGVEWEEMCDRVARELSVINQNCSRFMKVTVVNDSPPPEHGPPRSRSHLRLVKG